MQRKFHDIIVFLFLIRWLIFELNDCCLRCEPWFFSLLLVMKWILNMRHELEGKGGGVVNRLVLVSVHRFYSDYCHPRYNTFYAIFNSYFFFFEKVMIQKWFKQWSFNICTNTMVKRFHCKEDIYCFMSKNSPHRVAEHFGMMEQSWTLQIHEHPAKWRKQNERIKEKANGIQSWCSCSKAVWWLELWCNTQGANIPASVAVG